MLVLPKISKSLLLLYCSETTCSKYCTTDLASAAMSISHVRIPWLRIVPAINLRSRSLRLSPASGRSLWFHWRVPWLVIQWTRMHRQLLYLTVAQSSSKSLILLALYYFYCSVIVKRYCLFVCFFACLPWLIIFLPRMTCKVILWSPRLTVTIKAFLSCFRDYV